MEPQNPIQAIFPMHFVNRCAVRNRLPQKFPEGNGSKLSTLVGFASVNLYATVLSLWYALMSC